MLLIAVFENCIKGPNIFYAAARLSLIFFERRSEPEGGIPDNAQFYRIGRRLGGKPGLDAQVRDAAKAVNFYRNPQHRVTARPPGQPRAAAATIRGATGRSPEKMRPRAGVGKLKHAPPLQPSLVNCEE
jgi:hypothetical protein